MSEQEGIIEKLNRLIYEEQERRLKRNLTIIKWIGFALMVMSWLLLGSLEGVIMGLGIMMIAHALKENEIDTFGIYLFSYTITSYIMLLIIPEILTDHFYLILAIWVIGYILILIRKYKKYKKAKVEDQTDEELLTKLRIVKWTIRIITYYEEIYAR